MTYFLFAECVYFYKWVMHNQPFRKNKKWLKKGKYFGLYSNNRENETQARSKKFVTPPPYIMGTSNRPIKFISIIARLFVSKRRIVYNLRFVCIFVSFPYLRFHNFGRFCFEMRECAKNLILFWGSDTKLRSYCGHLTRLVGRSFTRNKQIYFGQLEDVCSSGNFMDIFLCYL